MLEIKSKRKKENLLNNKLIRVQVKISAKISTRLFQGKTIIKSGALFPSLRPKTKIIKIIILTCFRRVMIQMRLKIAAASHQFPQ